MAGRQRVYAESTVAGLDVVTAVQATRGATGAAIRAESISCRAPVMRIKGHGTLLELRDRNDTVVFSVGQDGRTVDGASAVVSTRVEVDFGHGTSGEDGSAEVWVPWPDVPAAAHLACCPAAAGTADHDPGDAAVEGVTAYVSDVQAGAGFTVVAAAAGGTWGRHLIDVAG